SDASIYTIVDLSNVWVEFPVYPHQVGAIRRGQSVRITRQEGDAHGADGVIAYIGPLMSEDTRVSVARVVLPNPDGRWEPGLFVNASVVTDQVHAAIAVLDE